MCSTYTRTRKCTLTNAHSCARTQACTQMHTHTHAYTGYVVHNLCSVTWISLASVKAAARAHASTEHAAGNASSQCARQMTEDTWASTHVHKTAQIKANYYVPDSTPFPPSYFKPSWSCWGYSVRNLLPSVTVTPEFSLCIKCQIQWLIQGPILQNFTTLSRQNMFPSCRWNQWK